MASGSERERRSYPLTALHPTPLNATHWFARFRRRTCIVSRSVEMVEAAMALFAFYHCNDGNLTPALVE
jgi:hypothetical protein